MNIEWKEINPDYIVSSDGQVGSRKSGSLKMLKPYAETKGYLQIQLCDGIGKKARMVHRLVAEAFLPPQPTSIHQINHKNGIKADNRVCNLEWVTPKENTRHRFEVLNQKMPRGEDSHQAGQLLLGAPEGNDRDIHANDAQAVPQQVGRIGTDAHGGIQGQALRWQAGGVFYQEGARLAKRGPVLFLVAAVPTVSILQGHGRFKQPGAYILLSSSAFLR